MEILFTKYNVINQKYVKFWHELVKHNESISRYNNYKALNCISGMSMEKKKALTHPYPSLKDKIKKSLKH